MSKKYPRPLRDGSLKSTRDFSTNQEKQIARNLGFKRTPNSGATAFSKGDLYSDNWLLEAKTKMTKSKSISIKEDWITKNIQEMNFMNKQHQAIVFNFGPDEPNYYIISELEFKRLLELDN